MQMSQLLDKLLTPEQRRACALPASVDQTLRTEAAMLREQVARLEAEKAALRAELDTLTGRNATPQEGCFHFHAPLGDGRMLVEADVEPADPDGGYLRESVTVLQVLLNGHWMAMDEACAALDEDRLHEAAQKALQAERDQAGEDRGADLADAREW
jgi:hypothetical protein